MPLATALAKKYASIDIGSFVGWGPRMSIASRLHEVFPREQVGSQTNVLYEYQYHQAAAKALTLLSDDSVVCVYCEWHDDYVTENGIPLSPCFTFYQVKTRIKSKGPWPLGGFFGLARKSKGNAEPPSDASSIFGRLWDHTTKFGGNCKNFIFVTDAGIESDFSNFLTDVHAHKCSTELSAESGKIFERILAQSSQSLDGVTAESLFAFLSKLRVQEAIGSAQDLDGVKALLASQIFDSSEVDLAMSEARKIGGGLVSKVRTKSHLVLKTLPETTEELRQLKGLVVEEVLKELSLSIEGYRLLRQEGKAAVKTLSRLHRLCKKSGIPEEYIPLLCSCKLAWTSWWVEERDKLDALDTLALKHDCAGLLKVHRAGSLDFEALLDQCRILADKHRNVLTSFAPITREAVFGLVLEIAVEAAEQ